MPSKRKWAGAWGFHLGVWRLGPAFLMLMLTRYPSRPKLLAGWSRRGYLDDGPWLCIDLGYVLIHVQWSTNRHTPDTPKAEAPF